MPRLLSTFLVLAAGAPAFCQSFDAPPAKTPDAATLTRIHDGTAALRAAVGRTVPELLPVHRADVEIYLKAVEWIVRHQEWFAATSGKQTLAVIEQGIKRAESAAGGKTPWLERPQGTVARGYRSRIDGSVQPYGVVYPSGYGRDKNKKWRLDIHLHGRDSSLTEVKHLIQHAPKDPPTGQDFVQISIYGRGNNAYRWAGEQDVFEVLADFDAAERSVGRANLIDERRVVLKGFSMGGAGTWHVGLRHPVQFAVLQPGAGFTTTHGYIARLPDSLPDHQERCLRIYDAYRYAENAFNIPIVAYSGEKDRQRQAAVDIETELERLSLSDRMTHLVAPGLEHRFPPEWQAKADAEVRTRLGPTGRAEFPDRIRFVTYTLATSRCGWLEMRALERHYERAAVDASWDGTTFQAMTANVRRLALWSPPGKPFPRAVALDGKQIVADASDGRRGLFEKTAEGWKSVSWDRYLVPSEKGPGLQGPIDDALTGPFLCVAGTGKPVHPNVQSSAVAQLARFRREWDKWLRGDLPVKTDTEVTAADLAQKNLILFGDPGSNSLIAKVLPKLPIRWESGGLVFDGISYDAGSHLPILIQPSPFARNRYLVLNSGHTFHEADFKGTNALLYPRLGDYALVKPTPKVSDPAAFDVVTAGLFDEGWQFPKK